jgi:hypothetical protein
LKGITDSRAWARTRVDRKDRKLIAAGQAAPFVAMGGRVMREWVVVNEPQRIADGMLGGFLEAARRHTAAMPPKVRKAARKPTN